MNKTIKKFLSAIGSKGRAVNSAAQKKAARINGKKGGRPRKQTKNHQPKSRNE